MPAAVVSHKRSAQNISAEVHIFTIDLVRQGSTKSVVAGAQCDHRFTRINIGHDVLQLILG